VFHYRVGQVHESQHGEIPKESEWKMKTIKCVNCSGMMEYRNFSLDVHWYECNQCHIIEGSEGSIDVSKMQIPFTTQEQFKNHRKKWKKVSGK